MSRRPAPAACASRQEHREQDRHQREHVARLHALARRSGACGRASCSGSRASRREDRTAATAFGTLPPRPLSPRNPMTSAHGVGGERVRRSVSSQPEAERVAEHAAEEGGEIQEEVGTTLSPVRSVSGAHGSRRCWRPGTRRTARAAADRRERRHGPRGAGGPSSVRQWRTHERGGDHAGVGRRVAAGADATSRPSQPGRPPRSADGLRADEKQGVQGEPEAVTPGSAPSCSG